MSTATVRLPDDTCVEIGGRLICLDGSIEVTFSWVDVGIGHYEYGGAPGFDSRMAPEDVTVVALDIEYAADGDDTEVKIDRKDEGVIKSLNALLDGDQKFQDDIYDKVSDAMADLEYDGY